MASGGAITTLYDRSDTNVVEASTVSLHNDQLEQILDAVDERTAMQKRLQEQLSNGFMQLARERYRDALAIHRTSRGFKTKENKNSLFLFLTRSINNTCLPSSNYFHHGVSTTQRARASCERGS